MTTFSERLIEARQRAGISRTKISEALGISYQSVSEWEKKDSRPKPERLEALAKLLGVSAGWLSTGEGQIGQQVKSYSAEMDPPEGYSAIPEYRLMLQANPAPGVEPEWQEITGSKPIFYPDEFFQEHHTRPEKCRRATVHGDSMETFIYDKDKVTWIEESCPEVGCVRVIDGAIYVISIDGAMKIKRLQTCKDGIIVISDNERYPPETYLREECDRIRIYGRVIDIQRQL